MSFLQGFSKLLGAKAENFVPFRKNQEHGRSLFINKKLSIELAQLNATDFDLVCCKLEQLSATAGGINAHSSKSDAMSHRSLIGSMFVAYKIFQDTGDPDYPPGVYITGISKANYIDGEPLPYEVGYEDRGWTLKKKPRRKVTTPYAAINGLCDNYIQAGEDILPDMVEKSWENRKWSELVPQTVRQSGFTLMYNPPSLYSDGKHWITPLQKKWTKRDAAIRLAKQLDELQRRGQVTLWTVHGDGAEMLLQALKMLKTKLDAHTFMFCAPTIKLSQITSLAKEKGFKLNDEVVKINPDDWKSRKIQAEDAADLRDALLELEGFQDKALDLFDEGRTDLYNMGSMLSSTFDTAGSIVKYVLTPQAVGVDLIKHLAKGPGAIRGDVRKIKALRNTALNNSTDHRVNPHMHPFKNSTQTNRLIDKASLVDVVKGIKRRQ